MQIKYALLFVLIPLLIACNSKKSNNNTITVSKTILPEKYIGPLDTILNESSGLIIWNNHFWSFNDSGGKNELYGVGPKSGTVRVTLVLTNARNIDWEDIAQDKNYIYVAETGNNAGTRHNFSIYRIPKKMITNELNQSIEVDSIIFHFADQKDFTPAFRKTPYDCEALICYHDSLYVFTKDWINFKTKVYGFPAKIGNYYAFPIDSFNTNGLITGADILPDGRFALIGYQNYHTFAWLFEKKKFNFFSNPRFIDMSMLENAQTEGICFSKTEDLYISCEQTLNYPQQIWKISKGNLPW